MNGIVSYVHFSSSTIIHINTITPYYVMCNLNIHDLQT